MNTTIRTILSTTAAAALLGSLHASAAGTANAAPNSPAKAPAEPGKYELKKKSAFSLAADRRAPFWPIGWVRRANEPRTEITDAPKQKIDEKAFAVTSILVGNPSLAVVNGRAYSEGELIRMPKGSAPVKVRVQRVADGSVTLQHEDQTLVIAMHRPELSEHKPDADLLLENR